jgi:hypothetical protein
MGPFREGPFSLANFSEKVLASFANIKQPLHGLHFFCQLGMIGIWVSIQ